MTEPVVRARGVSKQFGDVTVLEDVSLDVYRGEITLLLGPNGSGKTILQSCLAGGLGITEGSVEVFGGRPGTARERLTYLLQGSLAMRELTGRENAEFYADLHPRATGRWRELAAEFGIEDDLDQRVRDYSGGMERKLELAITLGTDVPLYFLDEPTAELDMTTVDKLRAHLESFSGEGKTVVMSSHMPGDAQFADRLVFVRNGELVARGRPDELMAAVPRVVAVESASTDLDGMVLDGQWFERAGQRRAFLVADATAEEVADSSDALEQPSIEDPTVTDLFNYYVSVRPELDPAGSTTRQKPPETKR